MKREKIAEGVTLYLGDCKHAADYINGVDLIVTSPPYNQLSQLNGKIGGLWAKKNFGKAFVDKWQTEGYLDDIPEDIYQTQQNRLFGNLSKLCRKTASLFYNHQVRWRDHVLIHPIIWFHPNLWQLRQEIIWDRAGGMMFNARMFCRFDERILWFTASNSWKWNQRSVGEGTIWRMPRSQNKAHPVAFPIELPLRCIKAATDENDLILDPYMGGGTVGVAAVRTYRRFVGIEKDEKFYAMARTAIIRELSNVDCIREKPSVKVKPQTFNETWG